jgi:hypothetical protein
MPMAQAGDPYDEPLPYYDPQDLAALIRCITLQQLALSTDRFVTVDRMRADAVEQFSEIALV